MPAKNAAAEGKAVKTTTEIVYSHLEFRLRGETGADICENFSEDVVILSSFGQFYGHDGVRNSARILSEQVPDGVFTYRQTTVENNFAFLEWTANAREEKVCDGADSFVIDDGKIILQTIHYTLHAKTA